GAGDTQYPDPPYSAVGTLPAGASIADTLLRPNLLDVSAATHPYFKAELLTKLLNNVTTRSNVFAVWCTVGYFEVKDDSTQPVKLGAEMQTKSGGTVRQKFFAVVDRTGLNLFNTDPNNPASNPPEQMTTCAQVTTVTPGQAQKVQIAALQSNPAGRWAIQPGTLLRVGTDTNQEVVAVGATDAAAA